MFEFDASRKLLEDENDRKPNQYVAMILRYGILFMTITLILNEFPSLNLLDKFTLRTCVLLDYLFCLIPQIIAFNDSLARNRKSKYVVFVCTSIATFIHALLVFFFAVPFFLFPMLLSVKYNSKKLAVLSIVSSILCTLIAPPLSCKIGFLDSMVKLVSPNFSGVPAKNVLLFVSLPWALTALYLSRLAFSAARNGEENIQNRLQLLKISRHDDLTGLYNQNMYKDFLAADYPDEPVGIMFFDVDGLKSTNDNHGHEFGDILLKRCADSLKVIFDNNCHGFRIGGDEFLVVVDTDNPNVLEEKANKWKDALAMINRENHNDPNKVICHMSLGTAFGSKKDLNSLIIEADKKMYEEKKEHHLSNRLA